MKTSRYAEAQNIATVLREAGVLLRKIADLPGQKTKSIGTTIPAIRTLPKATARRWKHSTPRPNAERKWSSLSEKLSNPTETNTPFRPKIPTISEGYDGAQRRN